MMHLIDEIAFGLIGSGALVVGAIDLHRWGVNSGYRLGWKEASEFFEQDSIVNTDVHYVMCGACGKNVPTTDGFTIAEHDCYAAQHMYAYVDNNGAVQVTPSTIIADDREI